MTPGARQDLLEWNPGWTLSPLVKPFLEREIPLEALLDRADPVGVTDDRPINEYYLCRRWLGQAKRKHAVAL
jgi:hypothetical protein